MHNPNAMQITARLLTWNSGRTTWVYEVVQRGQVVRTFASAEDAVHYIEQRS
jgi:hypothetical protein